MKYGPFLAALRSKGAKHVYLLAGEESYYILKAEKAILFSIFGDSDMTGGVERITNNPKPEDLTMILSQIPFFSEKKVIILSGGDFFREKKSDTEKKKTKSRDPLEKLFEVLENMPDTNYVIFEQTTKADKRKKFYKVIEKCGAALDAEAEKPWTIDEWLRGRLSELGLTFDREANVFFMGAISLMQTISLSFLDHELEKLKLSTNSKRITLAELERIFSSLPEVSSFALFDAVSEKDVRRALIVLEREINDGVYLPLILAGLVRHVRQLWQAKRLMARGIPVRSLGQPMGLKPYIAEKLGRAALKFDELILKEVFLNLADADYLMKTGSAGAELLEQAVITLCKNPR